MLEATPTPDFGFVTGSCVLPVQHHPVQVQRVQPLLEAEGSQHLQCFACLQVTAKIEVRFIPRSGVIRCHGVWNK